MVEQCIMLKSCPLLCSAWRTCIVQQYTAAFSNVFTMPVRWLQLFGCANREPAYTVYVRKKNSFFSFLLLLDDSARCFVFAVF